MQVKLYAFSCKIYVSSNHHSNSNVIFVQVSSGELYELAGIGTVPNAQLASRLGRRNSASLTASLLIQRPSSHAVNSPRPFPGPYSAATGRRSIRNISPTTARLDFTLSLPGLLASPDPGIGQDTPDWKVPKTRSETPEHPPTVLSRSSHRYHGVVQSQLPTSRQWNPKCPRYTRGRPSSAATPHPGGNPVPPASRQSDGARSTARAVCGVPSD